MHAEFIYPDACVCKVVLHQDVTNPPDMPTGKVRLPTGLYNLSATSLDAILNISNSDGMLQGLCL